MSKNGKERKEAGMELVAASGDEELAAAKEAYRAAAIAWVGRITEPIVFTCEDLRRDLGDPPGHDNNMGSVVGSCLVKGGFIKSVGSKHADRNVRNAGKIDLYVKSEFYADYLVQQFGEVEAARKILEAHEVSLLDAAKFVADVCLLPPSVQRKIVDLMDGYK
jgi:hypothetical protein